MRGFTLIELLVVMVIIGVLIGISVPAYDSFLVRGRDTKRKADLKVIQSGLQQYYSDQGNFPLSVTVNGPLSAGGRTYLNKLPQDPLTAAGNYTQYNYVPQPAGCNNTATNCNNYCLYASLEDASGAETVSTCPTDTTRNYSVAAN